MGRVKKVKEEGSYMQSCEGPFGCEVQLLDLEAQDLHSRFQRLLRQLAHEGNTCLPPLSSKVEGTASLLPPTTPS